MKNRKEVIKALRGFNLSVALLEPVKDVAERLWLDKDQHVFTDGSKEDRGPYGTTISCHTYAIVTKDDIVTEIRVSEKCTRENLSQALIKILNRPTRAQVQSK